MKETAEDAKGHSNGHDAEDRDVIKADEDVLRTSAVGLDGVDVLH
jgi:hypothetical protein